MSRDLGPRLDIRAGVTAVIGSGGKTTLLRRLAEQLPGTVILATSTKIFPFAEYPLYTEPLTAMPERVVCVGTWAEKGKLGAPVQAFGELAKLADFVLVEADGSKGLPLKAHSGHEPVIPTCANQVIQVVGLSGLGRTIREVAHRPERYAQLCGAGLEGTVTPELAARVLNREGLADRYVLNQADDQERVALGMELAGMLEKPAVVVRLRESGLPRQPAASSQ